MSDWLKSTDYWLLPEITAHLGFLLALIFLAYLIQQKRSPASTMAWLLLVLFLPYVGVPLYLMLGGRKLNRMARRKARVYDRSQSQQPSPVDSNTERFLLSYGVPPASAGNRVELLTQGEQAFRHLVQIIDEARSTIHITTYILGRGDVGKEIMARLARRAAAGVSVRLLLDDVGSWRCRQALPGAPPEGWGPRGLLHAHAAHSLPGPGQPAEPPQDRGGRQPDRDHGRHEPGLALHGPDARPELLARSLGGGGGSGRRRSRVALLLGLGLRHGRKPDGPDSARGGDRTTRSRVAAFPATGNSFVQVVASGPDVPDDPLYETLVSLIFAAQRADLDCHSVLRAGRDACPGAQPRGPARRRRPADRPRGSNHVSADLARESYLRELHEAGGHVLLYQPGMLHGKAIIFDDQLAVIGSANMDNRSLFLNYEVALFLYTKEQVNGVSAWARGLEVDCLRDLPRPGWTRELAENVVRLLSPLL